MISRTNGEGGIRPTPSTQVSVDVRFLPQLPFWNWVANFLLLTVVYGCLAFFGIALSTVSAHREHFLSTAVLSMPPRSRLRRRPADDAATANIAASYSRFSSDLQDASSIDQQRRKCRDRAVTDGLVIVPELEFADEAVSGTKRDREGLNALLAAAQAGRFRTLYFESLSRLARESVITMPTLKQLVYVFRVRVISVSEGLDSNQASWELVANMMAWVHEQYIKTLRTTVLRGQEEAVLNDWSVGDWCFGFGSEPIPGTEKARRGHSRPRMRVVINEDHAQWVRKVFFWFVEERRSLDWISRELTRLGAPKDRRSSTRGWHHDYVRRVLRNKKYIGIWQWGRNTNVRNPLTGQIMQEARPPEEAAKWVGERPHLRIVDDATFFKAQALLDEFDAQWQRFRTDKGKLRGSEPGSQPARHLLQGLVNCAVCGSTFQVSGANGKYLLCSGYKRGLCHCKTRLPRRSAEAQLLSAISERILTNKDWLRAVALEAERAWKARQKQEPSELAEVERKLVAIGQAIARLIDFAERGGADVPEIYDRLHALRKEKRELEQRQTCLRATTVAPIEPPTLEWIGARIRQLDQVLNGGGVDANTTLRQLVGGRVVVAEAAVEGRKRKHLVGSFTLTSRAPITGTQYESNEAQEASAITEDVVVSFRPPPPWAAVADEVKNLIDAGVEYKRIAEKMDCPRSWVAKALHWWHHERGLTAPDGRKTRDRLSKPTQAEELADAAKELWDQSLPMQDIASQLGVSRNTITAAIQHWYTSRGLEVPDGRTRRKELNQSITFSTGPSVAREESASPGNPSSSADASPAEG